RVERHVGAEPHGDLIGMRHRRPDLARRGRDRDLPFDRLHRPLRSCATRQLRMRVLDCNPRVALYQRSSRMNLIPYIVEAPPQGQAVDLGIQAREFLRTKRLVEELLAKHTGQPVEKVHLDTDRDYYMDPQEARAYGMIDGVRSSRSWIAAAPPSPNGDRG